MTEWMAKELGKPFVKEFSKPCPWCGGEMIVSDKTDPRLRQKDILELIGSCVVCHKEVKAKIQGDSDTVISEFTQLYNKHKREAILKPGDYKLAQGNLWNYIGKANAVCITTNGFTKRSGQAVMGRGCAAQALKRYPGLDKTLGEMIGEHGNRTMRLTKERGTSIVAFPVKPTFRTARNREELEGKCVKHMVDQLFEQLSNKDSAFIPGWATKAEVSIIADSAQKLKMMADKFDWRHVVLPMPGCGAGELTFNKDVKPVLDKILDQRFTLVTYPERNQTDIADWNGGEFYK